MSVTKRLYGAIPDGREVFVYTLTNGSGMEAEIITYGGIVTKLFVKDKNNIPVDVVLGKDTLCDYMENDFHIGAIIGRNAGTIKNGELYIGDKLVQLSKNRNGNNFHGGVEGFHQKVWDSEVNENSLILTYTSQDGEEGFPGLLQVKVIYTVTEENTLKIEYCAVSDKDTVCNLTNHAYFNFNGGGKVLDHVVKLYADSYISGESKNKISNVDNTPMDFRKGKVLGEVINSEFDEIKRYDGVDHHFIVNGNGCRKCAEAYSPLSGIAMEVYTNQPVVVMYMANGLQDKGKAGKAYGIYDAVCLETQAYPGTELSKENNILLRQGDEYRHITEYKFLIN